MEDGIRIVETLVIRDEAARNRLWSIYKGAFERLNERTPIHHGAFSAEEFDTILQDEDFNKFLVYAEDELVGVTLITNNLRKIPWVNVGYFQSRYPKRSRDNQILPSSSCDRSQAPGSAADRGETAPAITHNAWRRCGARSRLLRNLAPQPTSVCTPSAWQNVQGRGARSPRLSDLLLRGTELTLTSTSPN